MDDTTGPTPNEEKIQIKHIPVQEELSVRKNLELSYISINFLKEIAKWSKFISIVGFVMVGLMVLGGISFGLLFSSISSMIPTDLASDYPSEVPNPALVMQSMGGFIGFIYVLLAGFYFFPVYYLFNFSTKLKNAIQMHNETELEMALKNLKSHYKFIGILLIIMLSLYGLIFVGGIVGFALGSMF